ncbi:MAG TPA: 2-dehydropantoate 2-reductase [Usitatibacteraceae bacterium]|nr:2-dehydropantoate 2-reductase [Usitatibacteraceae bacterium]
MKILVLGAGGTGGYFGGRLAEAGADVTFLVREKRAAQIRANGLVVESLKDRFVVQPKIVLAADVRPEYDAVLLSCKAFDLQSAIDSIRPAVAESTLIVPLLNGMTHLDALDQAFGKNRVLGGLCQIAATLAPDGTVKSMMDAHLIIWGARLPGQAEGAARLGEAFAATKVDWRVSDRIIAEMWEKVAFLCTLASMTCLMRASVGDILAAPDGRKLMLSMFDACSAIAGKAGHPVSAAFDERARKVLQTDNSTLTASMLRDLEAGGPVEADHIVGYMLGKARELEVDDRLLTVAYTHLKAYEQRRARMRQA